MACPQKHSDFPLGSISYSLQQFLIAQPRDKFKTRSGKKKKKKLTKPYKVMMSHMPLLSFLKYLELSPAVSLYLSFSKVILFKNMIKIMLRHLCGI